MSGYWVGVLVGIAIGAQLTLSILTLMDALDRRKRK